MKPWERVEDILGREERQRREIRMSLKSPFRDLAENVGHAKETEEEQPHREN